MKKIILSTAILLSMFTSMSANITFKKVVIEGGQAVQVPWSGVADVCDKKYKLVFIKFLKDSSHAAGKQNVKEVFEKFEKMMTSKKKISFMDIISLNNAMPTAIDEAVIFVNTFYLELAKQGLVENGDKFQKMFENDNRIIAAKALASWLNQ